jgi:hypothetical protein
MTTDERIKRLEDQVAELRQALILVGVEMGTGRYEYQRALQEANRGNFKPLTTYIEKGGKPL